MGAWRRRAVLFLRKESREPQYFSSRGEDTLIMPRPAGPVRWPLEGQTSQICSVFLWIHWALQCHNGSLIRKRPSMSLGPLPMGLCGVTMVSFCSTVSQWTIDYRRPLCVTLELWFQAILQCHNGVLCLHRVIMDH